MRLRAAPASPPLFHHSKVLLVAVVVDESQATTHRVRSLQKVVAMDDGIVAGQRQKSTSVKRKEGCGGKLGFAPPKKMD